MNVIAVIVTHNRLALLKECIAAVKAQTFLAKEIVVINNSSTDGTVQWLNEQHGIIVINQENTGGAGGFNTGIKYASNKGADWIWLMDDDTICNVECLEKLVEKIPISGADKTGFICSKAVWKDGSPHLMNVPEINALANDQYPFSSFDKHNILLVDGCSFVSMLLNSKMVKELGLPYKQFYIWYDDKEYTNRIIRAGYYGVYCPESIALHKTPSNYRVDMYSDSLSNLWKHAYAIRNELFIIKRDKGLIYFFLFAPVKTFYSLFRIFKKRKTDRWKFAGTFLKSVGKAFMFNPSIDRV